MPILFFSCDVVYVRLCVHALRVLCGFNSTGLTPHLSCILCYTGTHNATKHKMYCSCATRLTLHLFKTPFYMRVCPIQNKSINPYVIAYTVCVVSITRHTGYNSTYAHRRKSLLPVYLLRVTSLR